MTDVAREMLKWQCKTWEFRATSYLVNGQAIQANTFLYHIPGNGMETWIAIRQKVKSSPAYDKCTIRFMLTRHSSEALIISPVYDRYSSFVISGVGLE